MTRSFDTTDSSGPKDGPAPKPSVPCTAVRQIAQECARAICDGHVVTRLEYIEELKTNWYVFVTESEVAERLEQTLNAINARKA